MSDEQKIDQNEEKDQNYQQKKLEIVKKVKELSKDSKWTIPQEILQEIVATYTIKDPKNVPKVPTLMKDLESEIKLRYANDEELRDLLLESIPADRHIRNWMKKDGWEEAVWSKIRVEGLFTASKRAEVIESLRQRALDKSDTAAKLYLTMSGDYSEKVEMDNKTVDTFREINSILHNKKKD